MNNYTEQQLTEMRAKWGIAENFVPVASAGGAIAWGTKNSVEQVSKLNAALQEAAARRFEREHGLTALMFAVYDETLAKYVTTLEA